MNIVICITAAATTWKIWYTAPAHTWDLW